MSPLTSSGEVCRRTCLRLRSPGGTDFLLPIGARTAVTSSAPSGRTDQTLPEAGPAGLAPRSNPVVSYPYEWPFEMLRDAARLQLTLTRGRSPRSDHQGRLAVQRPVRRHQAGVHRRRLVRAHPAGEPWAGYRQFCELFLNPLLVQALRDVPFQPCCAATSTASRRAMAPRSSAPRRLPDGVFTHVKLHARAERSTPTPIASASRPSMKRRLRPRLIDAQLRTCERAVDVADMGATDRSDMVGLRRSRPLLRPRPGGKGRVRQLPPSTVRRSSYSTSAPTTADLPRRPHSRRASVVAVDSDDLVVDRLYRDLRRRASSGSCRSSSIADPSPALGWRSRAAVVRRPGARPTSSSAWPSSTTSR